METIYERPRDYDLEHEGDDEDIRFYLNLIERLQPRRVLELACGSGRITIPLARFAAQTGSTVVGLELSSAMLEEAERKRLELSDAEQRSVSLVQGDLREWTSDKPFDLIVTPCSSLSHLLTLEDQIAAWRRARANLVPGGRFVVDLTMPDFSAYADSMRTPPRSLLEVDSDTRDPDTGERLIRYKTTEYMPHQQRAAIRFVYDKFPDAHSVDRYVSDFECHVYYPREVDLLFMLTGFEIESRSGDYCGRPLRKTSRQLIVTGRRPPS